MENTPEKIANLQVKISENCTEVEKEIIQFYWAFQDLESLHTVKCIRKKFEISQVQLNKLIASNSTLSFFVFCKRCKSYENNCVKTKTQFIDVLRLNSKNFKNSFLTCDYCTQREQEIIDYLKAEQNRKLVEKVNLAIDNKNWVSLTSFEREILSNCLKMEFSLVRKHYLDQLGKKQYNLFIKALKNLSKQNLITLFRESKKYDIVEIQYSRRLVQYREEIFSKNAIL